MAEFILKGHGHSIRKPSTKLEDSSSFYCFAPSALYHHGFVESFRLEKITLRSSSPDVPPALLGHH